MKNEKKSFDKNLHLPQHSASKQNPPGSLHLSYILMTHTDNTQVIFVHKEICQPGGAAINIVKSQHGVLHYNLKEKIRLNTIQSNHGRKAKEPK